jgi:hypothetical protein
MIQASKRPARNAPKAIGWDISELLRSSEAPQLLRTPIAFPSNSAPTLRIVDLYESIQASFCLSLN